MGGGEAVFEDGAFTTVVRAREFSMHNNERKTLIAFGDRGFWNGLWRFVYRVFLTVYQSVWFYFAPFMVFWSSYLVPYWEGGYDKGSLACLLKKN